MREKEAEPDMPCMREARQASSSLPGMRMRRRMLTASAGVIRLNCKDGHASTLHCVCPALTRPARQGADGTAAQYGASDSSTFINQIVSCVLDKQMLPYTTNAVYFVLTSPEVNINGARPLPRPPGWGRLCGLWRCLRGAWPGHFAAVQHGRLTQIQVLDMLDRLAQCHRPGLPAGCLHSNSGGLAVSPLT